MDAQATRCRPALQHHGSTWREAAAEPQMGAQGALKFPPQGLWLLRVWVSSGLWESCVPPGPGEVGWGSSGLSEDPLPGCVSLWF